MCPEYVKYHNIRYVRKNRNPKFILNKYTLQYGTMELNLSDI